jgi:oxygen-independent coproporphyrinogen-3 oxidase
LLSYLHIPFCHRICPYCSFYKHTPGSTPIGTFVGALLAEAANRIPQLPEPPRTLYLGGGTPSMLSPTHLTRLFGGLAKLIDFSALDEVTLEANPATFDTAKARLFRELGVSRVSLGIQSFDPAILATLGREHTPDEAAEAVAILREAGMPSVNIDLMFSIPGQSTASWEQTAARAISLQPDHISAYNLTYEEDTAFFESLRRGEVRPDEDRDASHFHLAHDLLTAAGFDHYETSNYARPGKRSTHNEGYWSGEDYIGLGPSAVSTIRRVRTKNIPDTARYTEMTTSIGHATSESETLGDAAWTLERIALGLRTSAGIPLDLLDESARLRAAVLAEEGFVSLTKNHISVTPKGAALVDPIASELC